MNARAALFHRIERSWIAPAAILVAVNCIPLLGALWWGWTLFEVVLLYWFENVVIGLVNILKMLTSAPAPSQFAAAAFIDRARRLKRPAAASLQRAVAAGDWQQGSGLAASPAGHHMAKLFLVPFFTVHYGMFCFVHGIFVFVLLSGNGVGGMQGGPGAQMQAVSAELFHGGLLFGAVAMIASHLYSYLFHFLGRGEFRQTNVMLLMFAPYGRVVVLHIAIIFGAFAIVALGQPLVLVILLIIGKTLLDWGLHMRSHRSGDAASESDQGALWHHGEPPPI